MRHKSESIQVRVRIPVSLLPKIEQIRVATGLFYPGEVLLLVFQWFLADAPRPIDKETSNEQDPDPPEMSNPPEKQAENRVSVQAGSLRDFMRSLVG